MLGYALRRLAIAVPLLLAVLLACFILMHALPGDPVTAHMGPKYDEERAQAIRERLGLDKPLLVQFGLFVRDVGLRFDFGDDMDGRSINGHLATHIPATIELALAAMFIATIVGISAGVIAAGRAGKLRDATVMTASLAGVSLPIFWLGLLAQRCFRRGGLLSEWVGFAGVEVTGRASDATILTFTQLEKAAAADLGPAPTSFYLIDAAFIARDWSAFTDVLTHLALPALVLATVPTAMIARITRAAIGGELNEDYVRTARAKGVPRRRIMRRHILRNAAIAIVTTLGAQLGYLLGGAVLTETIFQWPGLGQFVVQSILKQEHRQLMAAVFVIAIAFVLINLLVDLSYGLIDPRVRLQRQNT